MHLIIHKNIQNKAFEEAFNLIVKHYRERLYWHIRRLVLDHADADDVLQNTFIKIWKGLPKFRQESNIYTWCYRIATNESLTFLRKKKETTRIDDVEYTLAQNLEADAYFDGNKVQAKLQAAIATLPEKQRVVFNLKYFEEMKYQDMSIILDTSVGALKASYHHAVKKIEDFLSED